MNYDDVSQIISTNTQPNPDQVLIIKRHMLHLTNTMSQTQERFQVLEDEFKRYQSSLSAIRRIPAEILGGIFGYATRNRRDLVKLQLVCARWREAALLSHQLWNHVDISYPSSLSRNAYPKIATWLDRSGSVPRTLEISEDTDRPCKEGSKHCVFQNATILKLLMIGPSVNELVLSCMWGRACLQNLVRLMGTPLEGGSHLRPWDCVQSLRLEFSDGTRWATSPDIQVVYQESIFAGLPPGLTSLELRLPTADEAFTELSTANFIDLNISSSTLERLTQLRVTCDWDGAHVLRMLENCKNLELLELNIVYTRLSLGPQDAASLHHVSESGIVLPNLKTLKFEHHIDLGYLKYLIAPTLDSLDVGFTGTDERPSLLKNHDVHAHLQDFIVTRSKCIESLRTLRIYDTAFSASELASIVSELPALKHLTLDRIVVPWDSLFRKLLDSGEPSRRPGGVSRRPQPCLLHLDTLELLQLPLPSCAALEPAFQFLHHRGPQSCQFIATFQDPPTAPDEHDISDYWRSAINFNRRESGDDSDGIGEQDPSLESYGIQFSIEPVDTHGHY